MASAGNSAGQSRWTNNFAHRAGVIGTYNSHIRFTFWLIFFLSEFAFEIGSGLLTEMRRLQILLEERDKAIQDMKEVEDDLEKSVEILRTEVRRQEQSAGERATLLISLSLSIHIASSRQIWRRKLDS